MRKDLPPLPIDDVLPEILAALSGGTGLVLRAPTGAGKTTRVPPALLDAGRGGGRKIIVLEPRRIAARAAARRIAAERGGTLGEEVGYHVRFDRRAGSGTRLLVVTEGIFVQMLQRDPFLEDVGCVIFDEFHERNLGSDLALAMTRRVQLEARDDLAVVVMSATLDPEPIAELLGGCPAIESEGRLHPVEIRYLEKPDPRPIVDVTAAGVRRAVEATEGDLLVFLPGVGEIRRTEKRLEAYARERGLELASLYGDLPADQQDRILKPGSRRKIVLATNVAETSITLEGVTGVVDSGLAREMRSDPSTGLDRLELTRISRASADQRAGRAGRQGPGVCWRLWTAHDDRSLAPRTTPEIRRVDLAAPSLQLLAWGESDLAAFGWFEAPEPAALERALELLRDLGATDRRGRPTELGRAMARLPIHPRLGRLLVAGQQVGEARRAALCAALLSEREIVHRSAGPPVSASLTGDSDLLDRALALERFEASGYAETATGPVHRGRARHVLRVARQLDRLAARLPDAGDGDGASDRDGPSREEALLRALLAAYPDRIARRREPGSPRGVMVGGRGVRLAEESCVREGELFLGHELTESRGTVREALVRQASRIEVDWLPPEELTDVVEAVFDPERERVVGRRRLRYRDLVLREEDRDARDAEGGSTEIERLLVAAAAERLDRALALDEPAVGSFLARCRSLDRWRPELALPAFEDDDLIALLPHLAAGSRSFADLRRAPLLQILQGSLDFEQRSALDREAPERLEVPSGSYVRLRYEPGQPPVLAVRIQEMFGLRETPAVAGGRVPVLLHLLAPNMRPQQVTHDLASFWSNTYGEVRKELKARYPKHAWPEDPLAARPERRPGRRRS